MQNNDDTDLFGILCRLPNEKDKFFSFKAIASASASTTSSNMSGMSQPFAASSGNVGGGGGGGPCCSGLSHYASTISTHNLASTAAHNLTSSTSIYASSNNLNNLSDDQAIAEKKDYIKLLAQGICNVKCITEYENILCTIEAKQLQIDLNDSGGTKKLDAVKR